MERKDHGFSLFNPATIITFIIGILLSLIGAGMMFLDIGADIVRILFGILGTIFIGSSSLFGWLFKRNS